VRQVLFHIPLIGLPIYGYGLMLFLGFVCCTLWSARRARQQGLNPDHVTDLAMWIFVGGLVGARVFYVLQKHEQYSSLIEVLYFWKGGLVYYGGVIGGVVGFLTYVRRRRLSVWRMLDLMAAPVALGLAFGRVGCTLNGCCFGDYSDLPWAIVFPMQSIAWHTQVRLGWIGPSAHPLALHPTQLYALLNALLLCLLAAAYYPLRRREGETIVLLCLVYPITRFLIEYLRNDEHAFVTSLTVSQNVSVGLFVLGVVLLVMLLRSPVLYPAGAGPGPTAPGSRR